MSQLTAVDLFAGLGGSTTGASKAGVQVLLAANHWQKAVLVHSMNHPKTEHVCQDLRQADWTSFPNHDIMLTSPSCQGFTKARGKDRKHHDACRSTAWSVVDCAEVCQPKFIVVENVPEFRNWRNYPRWKACLEEDYHLGEHVLDAADHGVAQHRVRLFIIGVHKDVSKNPVKIPNFSLPYLPASAILNWEADNWTRVKDKVANTRARVEQGRLEFGRKPFLISYYGANKGGRSIFRPLGTITTKDRHALVDGNFMRMLTIDECRKAMGFSEKYILPSKHSDALKMLGNAVVPQCMSYLLKCVVKHYKRTAA